MRLRICLNRGPGMATRQQVDPRCVHRCPCARCWCATVRHPIHLFPTTAAVCGGTCTGTAAAGAAMPPHRSSHHRAALVACLYRR